jgi:hypothetical protein
MRKVLVAVCVSSLVFAAASYAGKHATGEPSASKQADLYQIENIEKTWHRAATKKNLDLMMSIWAPGATMTIGGKTYHGKQAIRALLAKAGPFQPENHWISDTPAYKIRATANGNKGTLYFECHYVDLDTQKVATVVGADQEVRKINGRWLISDLTASSVTLSP